MLTSFNRERSELFYLLSIIVNSLYCITLRQYDFTLSSFQMLLNAIINYRVLKYDI